jgi:hypothetical protein
MKHTLTNENPKFQTIIKRPSPCDEKLGGPKIAKGMLHQVKISAMLALSLVVVGLPIFHLEYLYL